ncbi:zinc finger protein 518A-like [Pimephales promelas]|uniref:zinc finger protein 518A-like n=1 Tax=Pimephales promelas TaxID=90988 RepID=UPI001955F318|nr:zinc finger protein 518A-like [Pimephales promelas]
MDRVDAKPDAQVGNEERSIWHKRLRLRKSSFSFPKEQNTVKEEKNDTPQGQKETKLKKPHLVNTFVCSACNDGISFTPGELTMHFKIVHGGKGSPPMFPCNVCGFSTSVFTTLQQHRMHHKDCLFTCEICNDNVQQTLPQLTEHCQTHHSLNGQYHCPKCKLSIQEFEEFICHSCSAPIISNSEESINLQKKNLLKHMAAACRQRWSRRNWWRTRAQVCKQHNSPSQEFKLSLPKPEPQWASQLLPISTPGLLHNHCLLMDPEKTLEETQQFLKRTGNKWPISLKNELEVVPLVPTTPCPSQCTRKDKLTGLMKKNNITVPPDCTTKVVGFKMVDGKKHLVLKVIPSNKHDVSTPRVEPHTVKPIDTSSGNCSQDFLSSVVERINSQQKDGCNNQEPTDCDTHINEAEMHSCTEADIHAKRDKALSESEENFTACQGDSGCPSDLTSDAGSSEERCSSRLLSAAFDNEHNLTLDPNLHSNTDSCSISGFDCISPPSRSPLKDLAETVCHFPSEDEGMLFHSRADECTNNSDPRESPVPVGQRECERETAPDLDQTPLTTSSRSLDEARVGQTDDEPLPGLTCSGGPNQQSSIVFPDDSHSSTCESSGPLASLNRKRMGETSPPDSPISKSQKRSPRASEDEVTGSDLHWQPVARDVPTTLRLIPYSAAQSVQIPRDNQPVIVLNHPDTEIPEVTNIMKVVHKHKDAVQRVVLSRKTLRALSDLNGDDFPNNLIGDCHASHFRREWPNGTVKERFSLKLKLKRVCGRKYTVVPTVSERVVLQPTFRCWFCGRIFRNQEAWVGHGQRHLMEATRGWFNR